jgi:Domain of unknown function (DUF1848)
MIISAGRRTDIPALYSDWFMNRVREGYFYRVNPFNSNQVAGFSLGPADVDAICFWTKNPAPFNKSARKKIKIVETGCFCSLTGAFKRVTPHLPSLPIPVTHCTV